MNCENLDFSTFTIERGANAGKNDKNFNVLLFFTPVLTKKVVDVVSRIHLKKERYSEILINFDDAEKFPVYCFVKHNQKQMC